MPAVRARSTTLTPATRCDCRMGKATRSTWDGLQIIEAVIDAGAVIKVLDRNYIDLTTPMGRGFMAMIAMAAPAFEGFLLNLSAETGHQCGQFSLAACVRFGKHGFELGARSLTAHA